MSSSLEPSGSTQTPQVSVPNGVNGAPKDGEVPAEEATSSPATAEPTTAQTSKNLTPRPRTPSVQGLALTEYSANPSPPGTSQKAESLRRLVPDDLLLPNGYPDVCRPLPLSTDFLDQLRAK